MHYSLSLTEPTGLRWRRRQLVIPDDCTVSDWTRLVLAASYILV